MNKLDRLAARFRTKPLRLMLLPWLIWLPGCAVNDYSIYAAGQAKVEQARYEADAARYKAMAAIAASGDTTAKVAAVIAMQQHSGAGDSTKLAAPAPNQALQWASVLVPGLTQIVGMRYNYAATVAQSNNARAAAESTNATFLGLASKIQAPTPNITLSGAGVIGNGSYAIDRHDNTLSGTGTLGSGAYTDSKPYTTTDSHTTTTTPAPVVTPVVQVTPTVITPVTPIVPTVITPVVGEQK